MDKWLLLCNDVSLAYRLRTIEDGLRADGITSFYRDVHTAQANGELAELARRFAARRTPEVGDLCKTNLSQPGGLVAVLDIQPYSEQTPTLMAHVQHVEDHPYGYKKGDRGWYRLTDLVVVIPGYYSEEGVTE